MPLSDPERDRRLAHQVRHGPRHASEVGDLVAQWMKGPEAKRLARLRHVADALAAVLDPDILLKVRPVSVQTGTLVLEVDDHLLMAELRNHHQHRIVKALVDHGTGLNRMQWRLAGGRRSTGLSRADRR